MRLTNLTWPEAEASAAILVMPVGSTEQHGPHLGLDVDIQIARHVAGVVVQSLPNAVLGPDIAIGASGEHQDFAGTLSVGAAVFEEMIVEIGRSADAFTGVVWVNAHGGNSAALAAAHQRLVVEARRSLVLTCSVPGADAHAGRTETSMMLAIDAAAVHMDRVEPGAVQPWSEIADLVRGGGIVAVSPNGVLGDPTGASAAEGEQILEELVARLVAAVQRWADE